MDKRKNGITVIDLFCGAGGFSNGFHMAGYDVAYGIDNWKPACETHSLNNLGDTENIDLLSVDIDDVLEIKSNLNRKYGEIDIVIGSPPCTEFSYAKKGGKGDLEKGMLLIRKHLLFISLFNPKYWLMENVPRLKSAIEKESKRYNEKGWYIPYKKIGIPPDRFEELGISDSLFHIPNGKIFVASDFGAHQNRKRFICGKFPISNCENHTVSNEYDVSLGKIINCFENIRTNLGDYVADPNYPQNKVKIENIRDYDYDTTLHPMYWEEMRYSKRRAIQYGKMSFPENLSKPSRTIMATSNSSSRESLVFDTGRTVYYQGRNRPVYRQPTVREVASIQGFPLNFQLSAKKINDRYKLVGNAVPNQLSYALALSILDDIIAKKDVIEEKSYLERVNSTLSRRKNNEYKPIIIKPSKVVTEAKDCNNIHKVFKARPNKKISRKLLSSKIPNDSHVVVFNNIILDSGKLTGSHEWKVSIHKGIGKNYSKVYIDYVSISSILDSIDRRLNGDNEKKILKDLIEFSILGLPKITNEWIEFEDYKSSKKYINFIGDDTLLIPDISFFQRTFTEDLQNISNYVSPIDFFDCIDALLLKVYRKNNLNMKSSLNIPLFNDEDFYPKKYEKNLNGCIKDAEIPMITIYGALVSAYILNEMYSKSNRKETKYSKSLKSGIDFVIKWIDKR